MSTPSASPTVANPEAELPDADAIMFALGYTPDDLHANQTGTLGAAQSERLRQMKRRALLAGAAGFLSMALLATIFLYIGGLNNSAILTLVGVGLTLCNALLVGLIARHWLRLDADLRDGQPVRALTGSLERIIRPGGNLTQYVLRIDGKEIAVKKSVFKLFRHEQVYRLYRTRHSGMLIGAEPLH